MKLPLPTIALTFSQVTSMTFLWMGKISFLFTTNLILPVNGYEKATGGSSGILECNQTMFNGCKWKAINKTQFELPRKNGSIVLWEFKKNSTTEAFRKDKPIFSMRLAKD